MAMNLDQIRTYIRTALDLEVEDLPDALVDVWIREGSKRIERAETRWPFYEVQITTTLNPSPFGVYPLSTISATLDQVTGVTITSQRLKWLGFDAFEAMLGQSASVGRPVYFSQWGPNLYFYPLIGSPYTSSIRGYRRANDWVAAGAGATPDMPDELHNTVATWALSKAYAQQEDPELAALYERQFADELNEFRRRLVVTPPPQPLVMNGGAFRSSDNLIYRPRFDWELT